MANTLSKTGIVDGQVAIAGHVTQSVDAFTGEVAYDISISGSLNITGSTDLEGNLAIPGFPDVSASLAASGVGNGFPFTGSAKITGSLELVGPYNVTASEGSNLSFEINESASFEFLTGAPNTGSFIVQTSPDTGKGALQSYFGQGTGTVFGQPVPNQAFGLKYTSGSNASEGELSMTFGKRDLSSLGLANQNNFYVAYEPSGIFTNTQGELELYVGEHGDVGTGVLSVFRGGASGATQTSSYAGYFSSSAFPGQQQYTRPFAISATSTVSDSNSAFVINKDVTNLTTSNFSIDYGGNTTSAGNLGVTGTGSFDQGVKSIVSTASISDTGVDPRGDILKACNTSTSAGLCYFLTGSEWKLATLSGTDLLKSGSMNNLLGIAIGSNSGTDGMLLKGTCNHGLNTGQAEVGKRFYIDSNGRFTGITPTDTTLRRIAGYTIEGNNKIYFNPQQTTL